MEIQESLGCSSKVGSSSRAEACDPQLSQQNNLAQPFCSFRSSIDRMMPTHTGEGHLLYSVHTVVIVQWLSRVFVGTYSNANLFQSHPHGYNQKQCLTIYLSIPWAQSRWHGKHLQSYQRLALCSIQSKKVLQGSSKNEKNSQYFLKCDYILTTVLNALHGLSHIFFTITL